MATSSTIGALERMNPLRLAGPLFDKELRVWSRRRRLYALRFVYICLFGAVVAYAWFVVAHRDPNASAVVQASRMAEVGKIVVAAIVWFQFIATQIVAAVLLSGAMATEVRQRTLEVLFTTPIGNAQIVMGKLLSGLLQVLLLLAISLPLLAIVRVFGGVSWDFVVSGLAITLATAIFIGALSLFLGIADRQTHQVAMNALAMCGLFWISTGILFSVLSHAGYVSRMLASSILRLTDPYVVLAGQTQAMITPMGAGAPSGAWVYCLVALGAAGGLLLLSIWRLRKVAAGVAVHTSRAEQEASRASGEARGVVRERTTYGRFRWLRQGVIRPVKGSPIVWKELRRPRVPRSRRGILSAIFMAILVCVIIGCVVVVIVFDSRALSPVCIGMSYVVALICTIDVASSSAGAIPREKEARTWPILLTTPLDNGEIVRGKAIGAVRRSLPLLAVLGLLVVVALVFLPWDEHMLELAFYMGGISVAHFVGSVVFLVGLGLFMGTCVRTVTMASVATLGIFIGIRMVIGPVLMMMATMMVLGAAASGAGGHGGSFLIGSTIFSAALYSGAGLLLARSAAGRLRRNVFS